MKIIICALLAVLGLHYATAAPRYKYTYGIGGNAGFDYHGDRELGFHLANGTYSAFTKGSFSPNLYGDAGILMGSDNDTAAPDATQRQQSSQQNTGVAPFNYYQTPGMPQYAPQYPYQQYNPYLPQQNYMYGQSPYSPFQPPAGQFGPNAMPPFNQFQPQAPQGAQNYANAAYNPYQNPAIQRNPAFAYNPYQTQGVPSYGQNYQVPTYNPYQSQGAAQNVQQFPGASINPYQIQGAAPNVQQFPGPSNSPYQTQGAAQNALPTPQNGSSIPVPQPVQDNTVKNNVPDKV